METAIVPAFDEPTPAYVPRGLPGLYADVAKAWNKASYEQQRDVLIALHGDVDVQKIITKVRQGNLIVQQIIDAELLPLLFGK